MKLTAAQTKQLGRIKEALKQHKSTPTDATTQLVKHHWAEAMRHTLHPDHLTPDEVETLRAVTAP